MSIESYRRTIASLDREIAVLERDKSVADKNAAAQKKKASSVSISKNASASTIRSKHRQIEGYNKAAIKFSEKSAALSAKIAEKRKKRNDVAARLQKEEIKDQKKQYQAADAMRQSYEHRISELEQQLLSSIKENINLSEENSMEEYDVFVSHAWEDKEDFVDDLVDALRKLNIKVWYDTNQMKWGDSMRKRIDDGLKKSRFGVAILSPDYIAEGKYWTKAELDGLFQLESISGKMLLPIWHNLNKTDVMAFSPIIASRFAMTTATMTPQEIAEKLRDLLRDTRENDYDEN